MAVNRNDPCPCGSGRKYKRCCLGKTAPDARAASKTPPRTAPPDDPAERVARAVEERRAGRPAQAEALLRDVIAAAPRHADAAFHLAVVVAERGDLAEALSHVERAIDIDASRPVYHLRRAGLLIAMGRAADALSAVDRVIALDDTIAVAHQMGATVHERQGTLDQALVFAKRAVALAPRNGESITMLARLERRTGALDAARARLEGFTAAGGPPEQMHRAWKELAFVLDELDEPARAMDAHDRGGEAHGRTDAARRIDRTILPRRIESYRRGTTAGLLRRLADAAPDDERPAPAFLVGFPRSGTTMTEQILAAHGAVRTIDERPLVSSMVNELGAGMDAASALAALTPARVAELRAGFRRRAEAETGPLPDGTVLVDKMPLNLIELPLINAVFPAARVIVALRDPRDVCLSCVKQDFWLNTAMIHYLSLESTARFYAQTMDLWLHLREIVTLPWIEVRYEDTVRDLEAQGRRILDHLDLAWTDGLLRFHERARERFISTPSFQAVTEPVHTRAIARWRRHAERFEHARADLEPFVRAFGYEW